MYSKGRAGMTQPFAGSGGEEVEEEGGEGAVMTVSVWSTLRVLCAVTLSPLRSPELNPSTTFDLLPQPLLIVH